MLLKTCLFAILFSINAFSFDVSNQHPLHQVHHQPEWTHGKTSPSALRVAVIGGGSAGSSAAYYLHNYAVSRNQSISITVYERNAYIGGRSTTINAWGDPSSVSLELGASIFVKVNHNLVDAVRTFNLSVSSTSSTRQAASDENELGIWNGESFVLRQPLSGQWWWKWWSTLKLFWRYGFAPLRAVRLMRTTVNKFLRLYEAPYFPFSSLSDAAYDVNLTSVTAVTGLQFLTGNDVGSLFANEVVQAATRVNYAQNLNQIHGLESMVCLATDGAMSVEGGNWRIFAEMLSASSAAVHLDTAVTKIHRNSSTGLYTVTITEAERVEADVNDDSYQHHEFDTVVLAAPYHQTGIKLSPEEDFRIPDDIEYVQLHVTLFASYHAVAPQVFNLQPGSAVPSTILTTLPDSTNGNGGDEDMGLAGLHGPLDFFSISLLSQTRNPTLDRNEFIYKIFSPVEITNETLSTLVGDPNAKDSKEPGERSDTVSWVYRKIWRSYPYLPPRVTFENIALTRLENEAMLGRKEGADSVKGHLWYASGMESFISTMETSSLMGKNIARLISDSHTHDK